jgi:SAM-dependent methyltransferase
MTGFSCRVCSSTEKKASYIVKEMMFGTKAQFEYDECSNCGSIQIAAIPDNATLAKYYPRDYYSFSSRASTRRTARERFAALVAYHRDRGLYRGSWLGGLIQRLKPDVSPLSILRSIGVHQDQKILDIGCGAGALLDRLARIGFRNLSGADPFLASDTVSEHGVSLLKRTLAETPGRFDLIMFNHSFEHLPDPRGELQTAQQKLEPHGICMIRIPTPSSEARETYGTDWAQWDAPRHLTLISRPGLRILAESCGFRLQQVIDDSKPWSLMQSELYKRGVPLQGAQYDRHLSRAEIATFRSKTAEASRAGRGDSAAFVLVKQ